MGAAHDDAAPVLPDSIAEPVGGDVAGIEAVTPSQHRRSKAPIDFAYHRAVAPMMWVLVSIACVELVVAHLLVGLWSVRAALLLSVASLAGIVWLVRTIRSFRHLPVRIEGDRLILRVGHLHRIDTPLANVKGLRRDWDAAALKERSLLKLSLIAWPNIVLDLHAPVLVHGLRRRRVLTVAHRLDDPRAFVAALERSATVHPPATRSY